jgi:hypothetical protein
MTAIQLELPLLLEDPETRVNRAIDTLETRFEKNRKSLHAKNSEVLKIAYELREDVMLIKRMLCRDKLELGV